MKQVPINPMFKLGASLLLCLLGLSLAGCAGVPEGVKFPNSQNIYPQGSIISTRTGKTVTIDHLVSELMTVPLIFIGEKHTHPFHHSVQLKIIQQVYQKDPGVIVGMEMFDRSYQSVLDQWSAGQLDRQTFLEKSHWYANWKFPFSLYQDILEYIQANRISLIGLNIPFHIPAKIAVGGLDNLQPEDKKYLPAQIDTSNTAHRDYVRKIFDRHKLMGRDNFEYFYQAQCVWEEVMAETIAANLAARRMIVLVGNGHVINHFGIPDRVVQRVPSKFRTIYLSPAGGTIEKSAADYIWVTPPGRKHPR